MDRATALQNLLSASPSIAEAIETVRQFPWDCDREVATLTAHHIVGVLRAYILGSVSADGIQAWANAVECRDDLGYDPASPVGLALHALANPELEGALSIDGARNMVATLQRAAT